jgi:hypothetical protein
MGEEILKLKNACARHFWRPLRQGSLIGKENGWRQPLSGVRAISRRWHNRKRVCSG